MPHPTRKGGHIGSGADPVDVAVQVASQEVSGFYLLNQSTDFEQTCMLFEERNELVRFY